MATRDWQDKLHDEKTGEYISKNKKQIKSANLRDIKNVLLVYKEKKQFEKNINEITEILNKTPEKANEIILDAIKSGKVNTQIREQKQREHIEGTLEYNQAIKNGKTPSILTEDATKLVNLYAGKGKLLFVKGKWTQTERFKHDNVIGVYVNKQKGKRYNTQHGRIHYSNKGVHIVPDGKDRR